MLAAALFSGILKAYRHGVYTNWYSKPADHKRLLWMMWDNDLSTVDDKELMKSIAQWNGLTKNEITGMLYWELGR